MKHFQARTNFLNLRTEWIQYIPTQPLSTHYRPVVDMPFERVLQPRGGEIPIVETHWVDNSDVFMGGVGDVIDVRVSEEAPLEFTENREMINKIQRDCQELIINKVQREIEPEWASFDAQIESEISETLEGQLSRQIQWNFKADEYHAQFLSDLEAELQNWTERACAL